MHEKRREKLKIENQRMRELGRPPIKKIPPFEVDTRRYDSKLREFERIFYKE